MWPSIVGAGLVTSGLQNNSGTNQQTAAGAMFGQNQPKPQQPAQPQQASNAVNAFNQTRNQLPELPPSKAQQAANPNPTGNSVVNQMVANSGQPPAMGTNQHPWAKHPLFSSLVPSNFQGNMVMSNPQGASNSGIGFQAGQYDDVAKLLPLLAGLGLRL